MAMSRTNRITALVIGVVVVVLGALVAVGVTRSGGDAEVTDERLVRADSHRLEDAGDDAPVLVEFLDFECEVCAAVHPVVEELRERFDDELTIVTRYFPLPGHPNSRTAAHAAEAAARQGQYEAMYQRLFETQSEWHGTDDAAARFRGFADELGLDLDRYDADVASDEVAARVQADFDDAVALGLDGTPSLFLDGQPLELTTVADLIAQVEQAVAG